MACVPKQGKAREWFTSLAQELNISEDCLEPKIHSFWQKYGEDKIPTSADMKEFIEGKPNIVTSDKQVTLWEKKYSTPQQFRTIEEANAFIAEASQFFNPEAISLKELNPSKVDINTKKKYEVSVTKPQLKTKEEASQVSPKVETKSKTVTNEQGKTFTIKVGEVRRIDDGMYPGVSTIIEIKEDGTIVDSYYDEISETTQEREFPNDKYAQEMGYATLQDSSTSLIDQLFESKEEEELYKKFHDIADKLSNIEDGDNFFGPFVKAAYEAGITRDQVIDYINDAYAIGDSLYAKDADVIKDKADFNAAMEEYYPKETPTERNAAYAQQSSDLVSQLDALRNADKNAISQAEVRHLAEQCVYWISDAITAYLEDPTKLLNDFPEKVGEDREATLDRIKGMTRVELVNFIGAENIINACKNQLFVNNPVFEDFEREDIDELLDQAELIANNFDAIMKLAADVFTSVENFSIVSTDKGLEVNEELNVDNDNFNESNESENVKEEEGSEQEHWQIESRTQDVLGSMSQMVRAALTQCYILEDTGEINEDGSPRYEAKRSKFGVKERVNAKDATNQILRWTQGAVTYEDMVTKLQERVKENPWVSQLITRLTIEQGKENANTDFQSQFFGVFCKHFQPYSVVIKEDGKYKTIQVNEHPALRDAVSAVTTQFKIGEHPMFTREGVNKTQFTKFAEAVSALKGLITKPNSNQRFHLNELDKNAVGQNIWFAAQCLGYYVTPEMVVQALNSDKALYQMANALEWISSTVEKQLDNKAYEPFKFKSEGSISGNLRKFLQPLTDVLEDVAVSSFYDSGKMYQSYVTPSYMTKLMNKFNLEGERFTEFLQQEYGDFEWFRDVTATDIERGWKNEWLRQLATMSTEDRQKLFKHKVQLNFNKHNYMKNMSDTEYALSLITEFFSETKADKNGLIPAWYRIPMLSNKPSSEFIQFYRYHGDFTSGTMSLAKQSLVDGFKKVFDQELSRIQTCEMRAEQITEDEALIKSFDRSKRGTEKEKKGNGEKFMFLDFMNKYLNGTEATVTVKDKEVNIHLLLREKLDGKELPPENESLLNEAVKQVIAETMDNRATQVIEQWKEQGIFEGVKSISNMVTNPKNADAEVENNLREFIWNDAFAAMNIMQLTVTDIAYYKDAEDLQKRLAQIHAPGTRANVSATDYNGKRVSDGFARTFYLTDFDSFKSNIKENVGIVFDRKIKNATSESEKSYYITLKDQLCGYTDENGKYHEGDFEKINVADAQGYSSPTSYRKKAFLFGQWSRESEEVYNKLISGQANINDIKKAFQPLKPFVYSQISKPSNAEGAPIQNMKVGVQNKNSEYLLIMADAILQGEDTGRPNLLRAIYRVMEESTEGDTTKGIDTVQFESTVKAGLMGRLDLANCMEMGIKEGEEAAYNMMKKAIGNSKDGYNTTYVHEIPFEDYCLQQPVPEHFKGHAQAHGSQIRYIITSDLESFNYLGEPVTYDFYDPAELDENGNPTLKKLTAEEFKKEYENTIADNIQDSIEELSKELGIGNYYASAKDRNIALSKILQREILSSPRYGVDLLQACSVDAEGNFRIPLGDPIQSKRVEQLINSIIKNRINKQKIAGGPVVQVTNFGTSKELNIRFKDRQGNLLQTRKEFNGTDAEYKKYIQENQAGVAYFEVFAPVYANELFEKFADKNGNIDIEAIEVTNPDLLKMIGYRIPTEDKYSMAPLKIVGFLPREAGEGIMMPNDITLLTGSDFDVDKMYLMRKEFTLEKRHPRAIEKKLFNAASESYKQSHNGKADNKFIGEQVRMFMDNPEEMRHTDALMESLYATYQRIAYKTIAPTEGKTYRNNKVVDMTYSVLTNETTTDKMMNPGGFDQQKRMGYMVEAQRLNPNIPWSQLESMEISDLKNLCYTEKNLSFIDTHIQFYKQNSAASTILGMFAVQKVAHAVLESNGFFVDVTETCKLGDTIAMDKDGNPIYNEMTGEPVHDIQGFTIAGMEFKGRMELDRKYDRNGQLIGKTLGSLVASAADAVKDPVLNLMNINSQTANILNTLIRMGMSFDDAAMFLSQKVITDALAKYNSENITSFTSLKDVIEKRIAELEREHNFDDADNKVNTEGLTREELIKGLTSDVPQIQYKTLKIFQNLQALALAIKGVTFATRFNSISAAVGPLIIDNLIMEHKMDSFSEDSSVIYDGFNPETSRVVDIQGVLERHPIIDKFSEAAGIAATIFKDMPTNSKGFRNVLDKLAKVGGKPLQDMFYNDRKLLSQLSDFYQAYMLIANDAIDKILQEQGIDAKYGNLKYFIEQFPTDFMKGTRANNSVIEKYQNNELIQAIKLDAPKEGRAFLKVDITGLDPQQKERLSSAWIDLHKENPRLSTMLFLYNYYRTGVAFSPKTFMSLVPTYIKQQLSAYVDTYRKFPSTTPETVIDQFIRNNWDNNKLVPRVNFKDVHITTKEDGIMLITKEEEVAKYANTPYFKIKTPEGELLMKQESKTDEQLSYKPIEPLGNNGEYLEISKNSIDKALDKPTKATEKVSETEIKETSNQETMVEPSEADVAKQSERQQKEQLISLFQTTKFPTREQAIEKIVQYKQKNVEDKKALEGQMKQWLSNRLNQLGIEFDAKKVDDLYKLMC